ncbi:MAG: TDT family transporter [Eubacterium sp.]|nr:TDT family transporter [Eubacterium sp.]
MPLPVLPTFVGALTLSNVYAGMGYPLIRHITMITATIVLICYIIKICTNFKGCAEEYKTVVPCSLYAAIFMITMILGSYYYEFNHTVGLIMWGAAVIGHAIHIVVFTVRNVIIKRDIHTFVPSWFVTYNGIMVSCVVGAGFGLNNILKVIVYYGIIVYLVIIPVMIWRLCKVEVKDAVYHTMAVVLAPCSLCVVSYLNVIENPNRILLYFLYFCVLASLLFIIIKLPKFFSYKFTPGFAGLTFPMAIGIVATNKMSAYMANVAGNEALAGALNQLSGIQVFLTTMIIGYVLLNFVIMLFKIERK